MVNALIDKLNDEDIQEVKDRREMVENKIDRMVWPFGGIDSYAIGNVSYIEDGKEVTERVKWQKAYELAEKKNEGKIYNIKILPHDLGKLLGSVDRSLGAALSTSPRNVNGKIKHAVESISMLYILGEKHSQEFTDKIKEGLKSGKNPSVAEAIGTMLLGYNMMDMYDGIFGKRFENINDKYNQDRDPLTSKIEECNIRKGKNVVDYIGYLRK